jgi:Domain of unknown function (DUF4365)
MTGGLERVRPCYLLNRNFRKNMPTRPRTHQLADQAINRLHAQFEHHGWTVEDLSKDYGEDLFVRIFENELATPYAFFVQAKATDKIARYLRLDADAFLFPIETGHLRHWVRFSEPVFLTLYDSSSDRTFWVCVQSATKRIGVLEKTYKKKTVSIAVPCRNLLDSDGLLRMRGITKLRFERSDRERQGARLLIDLLEKRFDFKVDDYDPDNEFVQIETDSGVEYFFLGAAAKRMEKYIARSGIKKEEFLLKTAEAYLKKPVTSKSRVRTRRLIQEIEDNKERDAGRSPIRD